MNRVISINAVIRYLSDLRDYLADTDYFDPDVQKHDITACEAAIQILAALEGEGCTDFEQVLDMLQDYRSQGKQLKAVCRRFQVGKKPVYRDGLWHCPDCNRRTKLHHSYCHFCGKKLSWDGQIREPGRGGS